MLIFIIGAFITTTFLDPTRGFIDTTCTISTYDEDDIKIAVQNCTEIILSGINVPSGTSLDLHLRQGTKLIFRDITIWNFDEWSGPLINITGTDIEIVGDPGHLLDARGTLWWDGMDENGGIMKPLFFLGQGLKNASIRDLSIKDTPNNAIWIKDSDGVILENISIDSNDGKKLGRNTAGIIICKSHNIIIQHSTVYNQDNCIDVKSGTNIVATGIYCLGGQGLSIGSVGGTDYNIVENVTFSNSQVVNSENGIKITTNYGATGSVTNVTYEDILLTGIRKYGIVIQGDYGAQEGFPTAGVPIAELTLKNITGTVKETGVNIYIQVKNASDWHWSVIDVNGGNLKKECSGIPEGSGITCN